MRSIEDIIVRLRAEFLEMPGLRLTRPQVQRLCGIEAMICQAVLDSLVSEQFLALREDGHYARLPEGAGVRLQAARSALRAEPRSARAS